MWFNEACIYQIYPLGLCGAPVENDGIREHRILRVLDWAEHIRGLNMTAVLFNPVFESDRHGYDTRDFFALDCRLGTNEDFAQVCDALHAAGLKVILDGVFNHVGRGFWAFRDVQQKKWDSPYKDWFHLDFNGDTQYGDGFWYEGWEGHNELVKLNLQNPAVVEHLLEAVRRWAQEFEVDGLRLDVAYSLPPEFLARLRRFAEQLKPEFTLLGETLHGDYNRWMNEDACHSVTNYECYKGLWSSFNSGNMFEIGHSLARQFGPDPWTLYRGKHLLSFLDNHDVERIASMLTNPAHLRPAYGLLFGMPGVPAVYYGSEWGIQGKKSEGDAALRPALEIPRKNELTDWVAALAAARQKSEALRYGNYRNLLLTNAQIIFERAVEKERVLVAVNAAGEPFTAHFDAGAGCAIDLVTGLPHDFGGGSLLEPYSVCYWQVS
ncbi:alpha-amylase family glycosyl hydrolase [Allofournierella sp.]|uniref:alpha-amylase family glycosyl hydrolase n=1 Tax=Allofournierella sp. TaxID=1940256 RepID=UPI003AB53F0C